MKRLIGREFKEMKLNPMAFKLKTGTNTYNSLEKHN